jgi:HSP20 family protein
MSLVAYRPRRFATPAVFADDVVRNFFNAEWPDARRDSTYVPAVNVKETDAAFTLTFAVPGRKKEDLKITVDNKVLTVSYQEEKKTYQEDGRLHLREFVRKSFSRSFQLPESVNADAIAADYTDGILTLTLPKNETQAPTKREIAVA